MTSNVRNNTLGLYIHFPWCVKKCPYCDFNSHELNGDVPETAYINALLADLDRDLALFQLSPEAKVSSIFMGGGTPSLFSADSLNDLLRKIRERITLDPLVEITLEANPGTTDFEKFAGYYQAGINRISLGVQSFGTPQLAALGRIHTSNEATEAFYAAREAGFDNINLDLMHGLPQQDIEGALFDLETAVALKPEHLSWYQLTIEPNTVFYSQTPTLPGDDALWDIFTTGTAFLADHGYQRYEVSAFHQGSHQSEHNLNYWQFGDYLGIGAGAHGKISLRDTAGNLTISRTSKTRKPGDYLNVQRLKQTQVDSEEFILEFLMNALRLSEGFELRRFESQTGLSSSRLESFLQKSKAKGLIEFDTHKVRPTELGLQYLNDLLLMASEE